MRKNGSEGIPAKGNAKKKHDRLITAKASRKLNRGTKGRTK